MLHTFYQNFLKSHAEMDQLVWWPIFTCIYLDKNVSWHLDSSSAMIWFDSIYLFCESQKRFARCDFCFNLQFPHLKLVVRTAFDSLGLICSLAYLFFLVTYSHRFEILMQSSKNSQPRLFPVEVPKRLKQVFEICTIHCPQFISNAYNIHCARHLKIHK